MIFPDLYFDGDLEWFSPCSVPGSLTERPFLGRVLSSLSNGFLIWATKRHEIEKEGLGFEDFTSSSTKKKVKVHSEHFWKKSESSWWTFLQIWRWVKSLQISKSSSDFKWSLELNSISGEYKLFNTSFLFFTVLWQTDILWYITT